MAFQGVGQFVELTLSDQILLDDSLPYVLDEIQRHHATRMARWVRMNQRIDVHVHESGFSQQARHLSADGPVDAVHFRVRVEQLQEACPRGQGWIT